MASSLCSRQDFAGTTCRPVWVLVRARPAGDGYTTGKRPVCGTSYTNFARETTRGQPTRFLTCCRRLFVGARRWGWRKTGPNPVDRARPGSKHYILVDANALPVSVILTGANRNEVTQLLPQVDAIPPIRGVRGRPLQKPKVIFADRGYDFEPHRPRLCERGIEPLLTRREVDSASSDGLPNGLTLAPQFSSTPYSLRTSRGHPRCTSQTRLLACLLEYLQADRAVFLNWPLRVYGP